MVRPRTFAILASAAAAVAVMRHGRRAAQGHRVAGGILVGHAGVYDTLSRLLLGSFADRIAADVAAVAPAGARVLEVGCGPGHLSVRLARQGFEVTGLDLDPAMIARTQANADRLGSAGQRRPSFVVGDVAALAFPDESCDLVVSTLSMHHWADPTAGLAEIGRVLSPGAGLGLPAQRPATPVRTTPCAHPRSGRPHAWLFASRGERHVMALALEVYPDAAH